MFTAQMRCKLVIALPFVFLFHFVYCVATEHARRFELPRAFGTNPPLKSPFSTHTISRRLARILRCDAGFVETETVLHRRLSHLRQWSLRVRRWRWLGDSRCANDWATAAVLNATDRDVSKLVQKLRLGKGGNMFYPLDIFKVFAGGDVLWRGAAENLVAAKARIKTFAVSSPGEYLVLDQHTGQSVRIKPDVSSPIGD